MTLEFLVSTDVDGTLIDHHSYSWQAAMPALQLCAERGVPVILNTSKTYQETMVLHRELGLTAPLIVENGSALISPVADQLAPATSMAMLNSENCRLFGAPRAQLLAFIEEIRASHDWRFEGFNDWSAEQLADNTGLDLASAERARAKQFSEPFLWRDSPATLAEFTQLAEQNHLQVLTGGRFHHLQGQTDKAKPLAWLLENCDTVFPELSSSSNAVPTLICLGDSHNDVAMLNMADIAVCVRSPIADYPQLTNENSIICTKGFGPAGWAEAVCSILGA